jgi:hypothetical protein
MELTVQIPDALYRRMKASAANEGKNVNDYLVEALRDKLATTDAKAKPKTGWRAVYGAADPKEVAVLQRFLDEECSATTL